MKRLFAEHLFEMKFIDSKNVSADSSNRNSSNEALVRAGICAGLYPNVAQVSRMLHEPGHRVWFREAGVVCKEKIKF
jgi:ATP-dependent RNA helicase DHX36